jgi:aminoglycoside 3-N-acetyltransferase
MFDNVPLYKFADSPIFAADFVHALKALDIRDGDTILVHSDIAAFGKLASHNRECLLGSLVDLLKLAVGPNGRLLMPAFSYSFCKNEPFDILRSKSTVGTLTEYFRLRPDVVRSRQPIFSVAIDAPDAKTFAIVDDDAFSKNGIFGKLHAAGAKIVCFGSSFNNSITFIHYVEQSRGVDYRYLKTFKGEIVDENGSHQESCTYYVRDLDRNPMLDTSRLRQRLLDAGLMKETRVGGGTIAVVSCQAVFDEANRLLDEDPYGLLEKPV